MAHHQSTERRTQLLATTKHLPPKQLKRKRSTSNSGGGGGGEVPAPSPPNMAAPKSLRDEDQQRTFSSIFNSTEFGSFLAKELPKMSGNSSVFQSKDSVGSIGSQTFLSKDLPLPKFVVDSDVFKSRDAFASLFSSKEWNMDDSSRRSSGPPSSPDAAAKDGKDSQGAQPPESAFSSRDLALSAAPDSRTRSSSISSGISSLKPASVFTSRDWMPMATLGKHIDVPLSGEIFARSDSTSAPATGSASDSDNSVRLPVRAGSISEILPAQSPVSGRTDFEAMFFSQLRPPVPSSPSSSASRSASASASASADSAASMPVIAPGPAQHAALGFSPAFAPVSVSPSPAPAALPGEAGVVPSVIVEPKRKRKRAPRKKVVPDVKDYVEPSDLDVLLGRGGRSNHHPGNKRYRDEVANLKRWYLESKDKNEKTQISQCLVDYVQSYNGRFLEKDNGGWYVVPDITARRKASQALREDNDAEKRAAKRARYLAKKRRMEEEARGHAEEEESV